MSRTATQFPIKEDVADALNFAGQTRRDDLGYSYYTFRVRLEDSQLDGKTIVGQLVDAGWQLQGGPVLVEASDTTIENLYLGPGPKMLFFVAEALLEYEQQFAQWRFKHVQLVERVLGPQTGGTGGTLGSRYLMRTIDQRFFPRLWEVRSRFFGGAGA